MDALTTTIALNLFDRVLLRSLDTAPPVNASLEDAEWAVNWLDDRLNNRLDFITSLCCVASRRMLLIDLVGTGCC